MTRVLTTFLLMFTLLLWVGCSDDDDDNPVSPDNSSQQTESFTVDASSYSNFAYFSFTSGDTVALAKPAATGWDIAFRREVIKLNGGSSTTNGGDALGVDLGEVTYDDVTIADTAGAEWVEDAIDYFIDEWYTYNPITHSLAANKYVYSMIDAEEDNYLKFRVDSIVDPGMPPDMGTVWISYFYQSVALSTNLDGPIQTASIPIGSGTGYFDFSSGGVVTPADPSTSTDWDIAFHSYDLMQNSGPNGPGDCAAFLAWGELDDPTDIEGFMSQPSSAPMFPDIPSSALTDWYNYDGNTHRLTSKGHVYLVKTAGAVYKIEILSYYTNVSGTPVSGHYTFQWEQL
ncbi:MAG TPA: HmuY family protein [candidate division Zixibacteria bacterium]|nr:HmuY family protein [candidate division Zixibacteria bacterium]